MHKPTLFTEIITLNQISSICERVVGFIMPTIKKVSIMYFTERLNQIFHMIFTSYDAPTAQEGLKKLKSLVTSNTTNTVKSTISTNIHGVPNTKTLAPSLPKANPTPTPKDRELGDAYALLARVYSGPQFTPEELGFPEDNLLTYTYLHNSIRHGSPIGTLQALRIAGSITPTVEQDMIITFDDAFRTVLSYAETGDAYCQYIIGNVYFWADYERITSAKNRIMPSKAKWQHRLLKLISSKSIKNVIRTLRGLPCEEEIYTLGITEATYWFTKALDNGLTLCQGNLRNIYIDTNRLDMARATAKLAAHLGNPTMMLYAGLDAHEQKNYVEAFTWFQKGANKNQTECISE